MICAAILEGTLAESIPIINLRLESNTAQPFTGMIYLMDQNNAICHLQTTAKLEGREEEYQVGPSLLILAVVWSPKLIIILFILQDYQHVQFFRRIDHY